MPTPILIAIIVIGSVLLIALIVFLILSTKKHKKNNYSNYRKTYDEYHALLVNDCLNMINRVSRLGEHNTYFESVYQERSKQYKQILDRKDHDVDFVLNNFDEVLKSKDKKNIKSVALDCQSSIEEFQSTVCKFYEDLSNILQEDTEIHSDSVTVKTKYRNVKEFFENSGEELLPLKDSFVALLEDCQQRFVTFDECADKADFDQAKKILREIEGVLDQVIAVMDKLPYFEASIQTVLPEKLDRLNEGYENMLKEDYCVEYMEIPAFVEQKKKRLLALGEQLRYLDVKGIEEEIQQLQSKITDGFVAFEKERKAKENYLASSSSLSESSYGMEKRYSALMNALQSMQDTYLLDENYVIQMRELKGDIENIGILKRELDSYLDTSERRPYVVIEKTMNQMISEMERAKVVMDDYDNYLLLLRDDSASTYENNRQDYIRIKKCEANIKDMSLSSLNTRFHDRFTSLYNQIMEVDSILTTTPVNVPLAVEKHELLKKDLLQFEEEIEQKKKEYKKAEAAICIANSFRVDFSDSKNKLDQAEKAFLDGDFSKAISLSTSIINMYKNGVQTA